MTYPDGGRCPDCRDTGMPNVWPSPGSTYCAAHTRARRAHQKRHHKRVERARRDGNPLPVREAYEPRPAASYPGAFLTPTQVREVAAALATIRKAEDAVRHAIRTNDLRRLGLAADELLDAGGELRQTLRPVERANTPRGPSRYSPNRGRTQRAQL